VAAMTTSPSSNRPFSMWLIAMLKGGVRKSTTAMMLAFALAARGEETLVVDADSGTQGVTDWATRVYAAGEELPFHVAQWTHSLGLLVPFIQHQQRETGAQRVIVDVGGEAPEVVRQAVVIADRVISPTGPEQAELGRIPATAALVIPAGAPMSVLLTRVPIPGVGVAKAVREVLTVDGYDVLSTEVRQNRDRYAHVWGTLPKDLDSYGPLAAELLKLEDA
jgi:cellulose biosynthesis protein BcsQ